MVESAHLRDREEAAESAGTDSLLRGIGERETELVIYG